MKNNGTASAEVCLKLEDANAICTAPTSFASVYPAVALRNGTRKQNCSTKVYHRTVNIVSKV